VDRIACCLYGAAGLDSKFHNIQSFARRALGNTMSFILLLIVLLVAVGFLLGTILTFWRSPTENPLAKLSSEGRTVMAEITAIEGEPEQLNIIVRYVVDEQSFVRSIPWPSAQTPEVGRQVKLRYLPSSPGLSRVLDNICLKLI
jgi:hypothetical protein